MTENLPQNIEAEIAALSKEIEAKRAALEKEKGSSSAREAIREVVKEKIHQEPRGQTPVISSSSSSDDLLPSYVAVSDEETRKEVEKLVSDVFYSGLGKAVKEAKKKPPFILDAFHDALVDKLHDELVKRGIIKNG